MNVQKIGTPVAMGDRFQVAVIISVGIYATGGVAITAADFDLSTIDWVTISSPYSYTSPFRGSVLVEWDRDTNKLLLWEMSASPAAQVADGSDHTYTKVKALVQGK